MPAGVWKREFDANQALACKGKQSSIGIVQGWSQQDFLATSVALHFRPLSQSVTQFRTSVAPRLVSLFMVLHLPGFKHSKRCCRMCL